MTRQWRFLLVEDKDDIAQQIEEAVGTFVDDPDTATIERTASFKEGLARLSETRFDLLILDLKDDHDPDLAEHDVSAGLKIFEALKTLRFAPVVFYTAHAHKVRDLVGPFVKVVEKTEGIERLGAEIRAVMVTGLPHLSQFIESIQRDYMWEFVSKHSKEFNRPENKTDIAYLMARRLAATLELNASGFAGQVAAQVEGEVATDSDIHPMQMYVYPTIDQLQGGDIVKGRVGSVEGMWILLTPTCDLVQKKADRVLMARCVPLAETSEYLIWDKEAKDKAIKDLIGDNRKPLEKGSRVQADRFKFLPGTFFLDDCLVDFQDIATIDHAELLKLERVACLDSPFAEALLSRFTRYFSRLGTPDISKASVLGRLSSVKSRQAAAK